MARRGARPSVPPNPPRARRPDERREPGPSGTALAVDREEPGAEDSVAVLGERLRRLALGLTAALLTARAYTWSEPDLERGAGAGLVWILALFVAAGAAIAAGLVGGRFRFRWAWADLAVVALAVAVAFSARHALDRRPAINLAWEWIGLGVAYLLVRSLPRTRGESSAIAFALVATAFAVTVYGVYQNAVELPALGAQFRRNPGPMLAQQGIDPGDPLAVARFRDRLIGSNEMLSTFALANSLAGFLVGPLVMALAVGWWSLIDRAPSRPRSGALAMAAPVALVVLVGLVMTKSRSAWIGLAVGVGVVAWRSRRLATRRALIAAGAAGLAVVALLVALGLATGRLDRQVLTQSRMSMRYRWEYWRGTWRALAGGADGLGPALRSPVLWRGVGPGNFRTEYLRYKLPESSEEIQDPHNLFLEAWATGGIGALVALALALGLGLRAVLGGRSAERLVPGRHDEPDGAGRADARHDDGDGPPRHARWLVWSAGAGWLLVVALGMMNLFEADMFARWLILGAGWMVAALLVGPLWRRSAIPAAAMGAAVAAVVVNLLAAGGIGIPTVALALWSTLAIGLNLREDRPCGRLRESPSRVPPFVLSTAWAAVVGLFLGAVIPFWQAEAAIADAEDAMRRQPPDFNRAKAGFERAIAADRTYVRPWLGYAELAYRSWDWDGGHATDLRWEAVPKLLEKAAAAPRNPISWLAHRRCAEVTRQILRRVGGEIKPDAAIRYQALVVKELRIASRLYPSNAMLHAQLAQASAEISMFGEAALEAEEALRLDRLTPHADRKLPPDRRERLESLRAEWQRRDRKTGDDTRRAGGDRPTGIGP